MANLVVHNFQTRYIQKQTVLIKPDQYWDTKNLALRIFSEAGEVLAIATLNPPDGDPLKSLKLEPGLVGVKDYAENEGMAMALTVGGVIEPQSVKVIPSGYITIPIHRLTEQARCIFLGV